LCFLAKITFNNSHLGTLSPFLWRRLCSRLRRQTVRPSVDPLQTRDSHQCATTPKNHICHNISYLKFIVPPLHYRRLLVRSGFYTPNLESKSGATSPNFGLRSPPNFRLKFSPLFWASSPFMEKVLLWVQIGKYWGK